MSSSARDLRDHHKSNGYVRWRHTLWAEVRRRYNAELMPRKVRELITDLEKHGFVNGGGKGGHRNFTHPRKRYQEKAVKAAIAEATG